VKSFRKELWFEVPTRRAFVNITRQVETCLQESGVREGLVLVNAMHITASVFINDDERGLHQDYDKWLERLAPHEPTSQYQHNRTGEDNADAHMKRQIMGREVVVAISAGKLDYRKDVFKFQRALGRADLHPYDGDGPGGHLRRRQKGGDFARPEYCRRVQAHRRGLHRAALRPQG